MSLFIVALYNVMRTGLEFQWYESLMAVGFALCLFNAPIFIAEIIATKVRLTLLRDEYILTLILLMVACLLGRMSVKTGYFFVAIGLLSFLRNVLVSVRRFNLFEVLSICFVLVLSAWVSIKVWDGHYLHPMLLELMPFDNTVHLDMWFHVSIAQMIKTYHVPSTGLNGIPFIHYHFGSHLMFACLSSTLDIHMLTFYQLAFPVIFLPFFFKVVLGLPVTWAERTGYEYKIGLWFWLVLTFGLIGIFSNGVLQRAAGNWSAFAVSESYNVSLIFFILTIHFIVGHVDIREEPDRSNRIIFVVLLLMVFMMGLLKISTLFIFDAALFYFIVALRLYKKRSILFFVTLVSVLSVSCSLITLDQYSLTTFEPFHFLKTYVSLNVPGFIVVYFFWAIVLIFILGVMLKFESSSADRFFFKVMLGAVLTVSIVGIIPGAVLNIHGGSAGFFMDVHFWFSICVILMILPRFIRLVETLLGAYKRKWTVIVVGAIVTLVCVLVALRNFRFHRNDFFKKTYVVYNRLSGRHMEEDSLKRKISLSELVATQKKLRFQIDSNLRVSPDYNILKQLYLLDTLPSSEKSTTVVFLQDPSKLSGRYPCNIYPLMIPALTGMAMKDGYVFENCISLNYSFEYYTRPRLLQNRFQTRGIVRELEIDLTQKSSSTIAVPL